MVNALGGGATSSLGTAVLTITTNTMGLTQGLNRAHMQTTNTLERMAREARWAGLVMSSAITAPIIGLATIFTKQANAFETAFVGVGNTLENATVRQVEHLEDAFRQLALEIPVPAREIADLARRGGELGVGVESIETFVRSLLQLKAAAPSIDLDTAATQLAQFMNIMGTAPAGIERLTNTLVALEYQGAANAKGILDVTLRIAGAGRAVGLTEQQILGFANALKAVIPQSESAGSSFSRLLADMEGAVEGGTENLDRFAKIAGMPAEEFANLQRTHPEQAILRFIEGLHQLEQEGAPIFQILKDLGLNNIRVRNTMLALAGAGPKVAESLNTANGAWDANRAAVDAANRRWQTGAAQLQLFRNQATEAAISFGASLVPALVSMGHAMQPLITLITQLAQQFASLPPHTQTIVLGLIALGAAIGPVVFLLSTLGSGALAAYTAILRLSTAIIAMNGAAATTATTTTGLAGLKAMMAATGLAGSGMLALLGSPIGWSLIIVGVTAAALAFGALKKKIDDATLSAQQHQSEVKRASEITAAATRQEAVRNLEVERQALADLQARRAEIMSQGAGQTVPPGSRDRAAIDRQKGLNDELANTDRQIQAVGGHVALAEDRLAQLGVTGQNAAIDVGAKWDDVDGKLQDMTIDALIAEVALDMFDNPTRKAEIFEKGIIAINEKMETMIALAEIAAGIRTSPELEFNFADFEEKIAALSQRGTAAGRKAEARAVEKSPEQQAREAFAKRRQESSAEAILKELPGFQQLQGTLTQIEESSVPAMQKLRSEFEALDSFWQNEGIPGLVAFGYTNTDIYREIFESAARAQNEAAEAAKRLAAMGASERANLFAQNLVANGIKSVDDAMRSLHPAALTMIRDLAAQEKLTADIANEILGVKDAKDSMGSFLEFVLAREKFLDLESTRRIAPPDSIQRPLNIEQINIGGGATRQDFDQIVPRVVEATTRAGLEGY